MRESAAQAWPVAAEGYEIEEVTVSRLSRTAFPGMSETDLVLRPVDSHESANVRTYDLFRDEPALFRTFADTPVTVEGILAFANKYGQLLDHRRRAIDLAAHMAGAAENDDEKKAIRNRVLDNYREGGRLHDENISLWIMEIHAMNSLLSAVDANDFAGLIGSMQADLNPRAPDPDQFEATLRRGALPPLDLTLTPISLVSGMRLQLAFHYSEPIGELRKCVQCGKWIYVGPGTGNRSDAKYCSQRCSDHARYLRRQARKAKG